MSGTLHYAGERLRKLTGQMRYLPRTLAIVREASGSLTYAWVVLLVLEGLLPIASVYLTRAIVNSLVLAIRTGGQWSAIRPTIVFALWMCAVMLATQLLRNATAWVRTAQSEMVRDHISGLIQNKSLEVDLAFYDSPDFYDHLHRARLEATYRPIELLEGLGTLLKGGITAIAILAILIPYGPLLPLALLLSAAPVFYVAVKMAHRRHRWRQNTTTEDRRSWYYDTLLTDGGCAAELRLFDLGGHFSQTFQKIRRRLRQERLSLARQESFSELWAGAVALLVVVCAMAWMTMRAIYGQVSLGDLSFFYQAFNQAFGLSRTMLDNLGKFYENSLFLGNLFEFLDLKSRVASSSQAHPLPSPVSSGIKFERVNFRYPGGRRLALREFSLEIQPGQTVALVGPNGTGKSTLMKLLCRFYDPESGSIAIDGVPLREFSIPELRRSITVFFQQPVRYNDTVASNIRFGDLHLSGIDSARAVERAAQLAGLVDIIDRLPNGYDTLLGRDFLNGTELSVGEWQRVALARAVLRQVPILILDEPTSAMDPWAELNWAEHLREIAVNRITLLITHRFTTAMFADVIHVMSEGRIIESGTHAQLLAKAGVYAQGWASHARV